MSGRFTVSYRSHEHTGRTAGRVGFVVDAQLPSLRTCLSKRTFRPLLTGWPSSTPGTFMRFGWIARHINQSQDNAWHYELYRPWRSYRAVVFVKSMDEPCQNLALSLKEAGSCPIFDANVDYFTPATGPEYYAGMAPTAQQRQQSCTMATIADAVIADSSYLLEKVLPLNSRAAWIPDNVPDPWIAGRSDWSPVPGERLVLLWSGEAVKLFEILRIEQVLRRFKEHVRLRVVTGNLKALSQIHAPWQGRLRRLLEELECEVLRFKDIPSLLKVYDQGGVCFSPRFLDNSYNMGHTEWKISLAMARGRVALASPQPSYCDVADRAGGRGIRICADEGQWEIVLESMLAGTFPWDEEQDRACAVVRHHYATSVVAQKHADWLKAVCAGEREKKHA